MGGGSLLLLVLVLVSVGGVEIRVVRGGIRRLRVGLGLVLWLGRRLGLGLRGRRGRGVEQEMRGDGVEELVRPGGRLGRRRGVVAARRRGGAAAGAAVAAGRRGRVVVVVARHLLVARRGAARGDGIGAGTE